MSFEYAGKPFIPKMEAVEKLLKNKMSSDLSRYPLTPRIAFIGDTDSGKTTILNSLFSDSGKRAGHTHYGRGTHIRRAIVEGNICKQDITEENKNTEINPEKIEWSHLGPVWCSTKFDCGIIVQDFPGIDDKDLKGKSVINIINNEISFFTCVCVVIDVRKPCKTIGVDKLLADILSLKKKKENIKLWIVGNKIDSVGEDGTIRDEIEKSRYSALQKVITDKEQKLGMCFDKKFCISALHASQEMVLAEWEKDKVGRAYYGHLWYNKNQKEKCNF